MNKDLFRDCNRVPSFSNIKVIEKIGRKQGKKVVILAGVHGDESFGVKMLEKLIPKLDIDVGKVTFIFANMKAINENKRFIEANLNRCFLKEQSKGITNTLEGETAREIMSYLEEADFMLDIHASFTKDSIPFIICQPQSFEFAKILPFDIISWNWDEFESGSTDYYMNLQNKIGICIECGYMYDPKSEERGKKALINFLIKTETIKGQIREIDKKRYLKIINLYKNRKGPFRKLRYFPDFERLNKRTLLGFDGNRAVFVEKDNYVLFVRNMEDLGEECFLVAEETLLNKKRLNELSKEALK